jgi:hypothetical protein
MVNKFNGLCEWVRDVRERVEIYPIFTAKIENTEKSNA